MKAATSAEKIGTSVLLALSLVSMLGVMACESGGGGGSGGSTVVGNVSAFEGGTAFYMPPAAEQGALARFVSGIGELLVPSASATVPGVTVRVRGTGSSSSTDDSGHFELHDVPSGEHELEFEFHGSRGTLPLSVPDSATITLQNIHIHSDGSSTVGHMEIEIEPEDNHQQGDDDPNGDRHGDSSTNDDTRTSNSGPGSSNSGSGSSGSGSSGSGSGSGSSHDGSDDGAGHT